MSSRNLIIEENAVETFLEREARVLQKMFTLDEIHQALDRMGSPVLATYLYFLHASYLEKLEEKDQ